jgi:tetratricopeptide (TPR) repeat protein
VDRLETALQARPDDPDLLYYLSHAHDRLARQLFEKLRESHPESPRTHQMTAEALAAGGNRAAYKLGLVLANRGRAEDALSELRRANELQPNMPETLLELGKALNASGDAKSAEPVLRQLLSIESDGALAEAAHFQLAQAYRKLGRAADADRELKLFQKMRTRRKNR